MLECPGVLLSQGSQRYFNKIIRKLVLQKQLVLNTWSGLLMDEASLPDDWTYKGVLMVCNP
jgi:hypothetical protein